MTPGDWCTEDGAKRLKNKIEEFWKERGYDVDVRLEDAGFMPAMRSARCDVRSDMVNGMPQRIQRGEERVRRTPRTGAQQN